MNRKNSRVRLVSENRHGGEMPMASFCRGRRGAFVVKGTLGETVCSKRSTFRLRYRAEAFATEDSLGKMLDFLSSFKRKAGWYHERNLSSRGTKGFICFERQG